MDDDDNFIEECNIANFEQAIGIAILGSTIVASQTKINQEYSLVILHDKRRYLILNADESFK